MSSPAYRSEINPLNPVAIKLGQGNVHAPNHETWDVVKCPHCADKFALGPNQIYGSRITKEDATKDLFSLLTDDYNHHRRHQASYELPD